MNAILTYLQSTGFAGLSWGNALMGAVGILLIILAIRKNWEPLLLVPIGFGVIVGNIPVGMLEGVSVFEDGSFLNTIYMGVKQGIFPPLIFLGLGAMTDFSAMLAKPKLILLGAAAQAGIFLTMLGALALGFPLNEAASIGIIGGADGPTTIFVTSKLAPQLLGATAIAGYSYMALVPFIQPPIIKLLTTREERRIRMKPQRQVSRMEKILFPIAGANHHHPAGTGSSSPARNLVFREHPQGKRGNRTSGPDRPDQLHRFGNHSPGILHRSEHPG
jgi:sodium ion-translocating decarboxylase beta subunit